MARVTVALLLLLPGALCQTVLTCGARRTVGCACKGDFDYECVAGATCVSGVCKVSAGLGQDCTDGIWCATGLACSSATYKCAPVPGLGDACAMGRTGPNVCGTPETLGCNGATDKCALLPKLNEPCTKDNRCAPNLGCDFMAANGATCLALRTAGQACQNDQICGAGTYCNFFTGKCANKLNDGTSCSTGNECKVGSVCLSKCAPTPTIGQNCVDTCLDPNTQFCGVHLAKCPATTTAAPTATTTAAPTAKPPTAVRRIPTDGAMQGSCATGRMKDCKGKCWSPFTSIKRVVGNGKCNDLLAKSVDLNCQRFFCDGGDCGAECPPEKAGFNADGTSTDGQEADLSAEDIASISAARSIVPSVLVVAVAAAFVL